MLTPDEMIVLRLARRRIESRSNFFLCNAIRHAARQNPYLKKAADRLCAYINQELGVVDPYDPAVLGAWQRAHGIEHDGDQQVADRLAWIDWMLGDGSC